MSKFKYILNNWWVLSLYIYIYIERRKIISVGIDEAFVALALWIMTYQK